MRTYTYLVDTNNHIEDTNATMNTTREIYNYIRMRGAKKVMTSLTDVPGIIRVQYIPLYCNQDKLLSELQEIFPYTWALKEPTAKNSDPKTED